MRLTPTAPGYRPRRLDSRDWLGPANRLAAYHVRRRQDRRPSGGGQVPGIVPALRSALLTPIRNGDRTVLWARPGQGFANLLYLWMAAAGRHERGEDVLVRHADAMEPWLPVLPRLRELTVDEARIRFRDRRDLGWYQTFATDFTRADLETFVRSYLLGSPLLGDGAGYDDRQLVVNVRRGDYYSDPGFRGKYSFDVAEYLRVAVPGGIAADGAVDTLLVVSDDPDWCRLKLGFLSEYAARVEHLEAGLPHEHFRALASSRRLVLANSTFSYWGAYVSNVVHGDNHQQVWAPWFHRRDIDGGRAWQLDPQWSVVRDLPGGWDA
jgi:hypothetical protein